MDNIIVEYKIVIDKFSKEGSTYTCKLKNENELSSNQHYEYENETIHQNLENSENKQQYINSNNIITLYIDDMINIYLYDSLVDIEFENISQLNEKLLLKTIDYNQINSFILNNIDNAINNIAQKFLVNSNGIFYFCLKYNKYTYYPKEYINRIIEHIHQLLRDNYNIIYNND